MGGSAIDRVAGWSQFESNLLLDGCFVARCLFTKSLCLGMQKGYLWNFYTMILIYKVLTLWLLPLENTTQGMSL